MHTSLRATLGATVLTIAATAAVAAAVEPGAADEADSGQVTASAHATAAPHVEPELGPVTTSDIDPAVLAAAQTGASGEGQSVTEVIELTVVGGDLQLVTDHATVSLERVGSSREWVGTVPPVRVIDARGTGDGWTVRWTVADVSVGSAGRVRLAGDEPTVVAGLPDGLYGQRGRTLFGAEPGYGGGTYEAGGTVSVRLPKKVEADEVVVDLTFSIS
jgi:hypothetical protein